MSGQQTQAASVHVQLHKCSITSNANLKHICLKAGMLHNGASKTYFIATIETNNILKLKININENYIYFVMFWTSEVLGKDM